MGNAVIAPRPPDDGMAWECQCARCGSSVNHLSCDTCGGYGWTEDDEDPFCASRLTCLDCAGAREHLECVSDEAWCNAHPVEGRRDVARGAFEWFTFGEHAGVKQ